MRTHKKFDGSTGLLDLDFIFMFRVIDLRSGDKDDDSDGTPGQWYDTQCLQDGICITSVPFIYKANGRGELILKELALEGVDDRFW